MLQMMDHYVERISSFEVLVNIFPELENDLPPGKADTRVIPYLLANLILRIGELQSYHRLWALNQLHRLLADSETAALLQSAFGFSYPQLAELIGREVIFAEDADSRVLELSSSICALKSEVQALATPRPGDSTLFSRVLRKLKL